jgi:putative DNA primase/helicase
MERIEVLPRLSPRGFVRWFCEKLSGDFLVGEDNGELFTWRTNRYVNSRFDAKKIIYRNIDEFQDYLMQRFIEASKNNYEIVDNFKNRICEADIKRMLNKVDSSGFINDVYSLLNLEVQMNVTQNDMNRWTNLLNVENGIIELNTGKLLKHDKKYRITRVSNVVYDRYAKCDKFECVIRSIFVTESMIEYAQMLFGYFLTGLTKEQKVFVFYGYGANGKSLLARLIQAIMGPFAITTPTSTFLKKSANSNTADLARMNTVRFVQCNELEENADLDEEKIKHMTGEEDIAARFLFANYFQFKPFFKLLMCVNNLPSPKNFSEGDKRSLDSHIF